VEKEEDSVGDRNVVVSAGVGCKRVGFISFECDQICSRQILCGKIIGQMEKGGLGGLILASISKISKKNNQFKINPVFGFGRTRMVALQ
jgi:hypothetical protein